MHIRTIRPDYFPPYTHQSQDCPPSIEPPLPGSSTLYSATPDPWGQPYFPALLTFPGFPSSRPSLPSMGCPPSLPCSPSPLWVAPPPPSGLPTLPPLLPLPPLGCLPSLAHPPSPPSLPSALPLPFSVTCHIRARTRAVRSSERPAQCRGLTSQTRGSHTTSRAAGCSQAQSQRLRREAERERNGSAAQSHRYRA